MKIARPFIANQVHSAYRAYRKEQIASGRNGYDAKILIEFAELNGYTLFTAKVPGRIGRGTKVHTIYADGITLPDGDQVVFSARDNCGSSKWNASGGYSGIALFDEDTPVTCAKCLKKL